MRQADLDGVAAVPGLFVTPIIKRAAEAVNCHDIALAQAAHDVAERHLGQSGTGALADEQVRVAGLLRQLVQQVDGGQA